jgi:hypothetical protein
VNHKDVSITKLLEFPVEVEFKPIRVDRSERTDTQPFNFRGGTVFEFGHLIKSRICYLDLIGPESCVIFAFIFSMLICT